MTVSPEQLSLQVKAEAHRLGFSACGVAKAEPVEPAFANEFRLWLRQGNHADMHYMENYLDKRLDPRLLMDGLQSIVSVALNYAPSQTLPKGEYQFAAYALGKDYHDVVKQKLRQLATFFSNLLQPSINPDDNPLTTAPLQYRVFSDSAPILERYWAVKAGLGWTGRNHQLIIPRAGSMFFLGELFVSVPMHPDAPIANHCGTCQRCVDACPTGALSLCAPFRADRCLSYQTIENRGKIPSDIVEKMGDTIYGCDRCQQACPWNHFARPTEEPLLQPTDELLHMTKARWQHLTEEEYRQLFKGSAVKRAKYAGLMRNIHAVQSKKDKNV